MARLAALYDFAFGAILGIGGTLLAIGRGDAAMGFAAIAAVIRFTIGRKIMEQTRDR